MVRRLGNLRFDCNTNICIPSLFRLFLCCCDVIFIYWTSLRNLFQKMFECLRCEEEIERWKQACEEEVAQYQEFCANISNRYKEMYEYVIKHKENEIRQHYVSICDDAWFAHEKLKVHAAPIVSSFYTNFFHLSEVAMQPNANFRARNNWRRLTWEVLALFQSDQINNVVNEFDEFKNVHTQLERDYRRLQFDYNLEQERHEECKSNLQKTMEELENYQSIEHKLQDTISQNETLSASVQEHKAQSDYLQFQLDELQHTLSTERQKLSKYNFRTEINDISHHSKLF